MLVRASDSVLVIVDVQERLAAAMAAADRERVTRNARILLQAAACLRIPVLVTEQYPKGLGPTVAELAGMLPAGAARIEKTSFSCAGSEPFSAAIADCGRPQLILAGMEAHVCILQSALGLQSDRQQVYVVEDACCSRNSLNHSNAIERLRAAGITITNTESVVFEWLRDARHEQFRAISALLR